MVYRHSGVIDSGMLDAERVDLRHPAEVIQCPGPGSLSGCVDLIDCDYFAWLGFGDQIVVLIAPPGGGIAAKGFARVIGIGAGTESDVKDTNLQDVARRRYCAGSASALLTTVIQPALSTRWSRW